MKLQCAIWLLLIHDQLDETFGFVVTFHHNYMFSQLLMSFESVVVKSPFSSLLVIYLFQQKLGGDHSNYIFSNLITNFHP